MRRLDTPRYVAILPGGITDIWNNANTARLSAEISNDINYPVLRAATYYTGNSTVYLKFSEDIKRHDDTKIILYNASGINNVTFASGDFVGNRTIFATLDTTDKATFEGLDGPRYVVILPGGVTDLQDNSNILPLTYTIREVDTTPPTISSAIYRTSGIMTMKFSERIGSANPSLFSITDNTGNLGVFSSASISGDTVTAVLNSADVSIFGSSNMTLDNTTRSGP